MYLQAAFTGSNSGSTIRITENGGTPILVNLPGTGSFMWSVSSSNNMLGTGINYSNYCTALATALTSTSSLGATYSVSINPDLKKMFITASGLTSLVISVPSSSFAFTGFTSGTYTAGSTPISGAGIISYFWVSTYPERSKVKPGFEPKPFYYVAETGDGTPYTIGWTRGSTRSQWNFPMEPKANVFTLDSADTSRWGWDKTIRHMRSQHPFVMHSALTSISGSPTDNAWYLMDPQSSTFDPVPAVAEWQEYWHINNIRAYVLYGTNKM